MAAQYRWVHGMDRRRRTERVAAVLEVVGLADRADDRADEYSGGMQRRLNIAVGLLHEPRLLVLDEPTVGVDPQSRDAILRTVEDLAGEGLSVLYTTQPGSRAVSTTVPNSNRSPP